MNTILTINDVIGSNISLNDKEKKLLFSCLIKDENYAYELIENTDNKLLTIPIQEKVDIEINKAIKEETLKYHKRAIYGTKVMQKSQISICRTITMLVALKKMFDKNINISDFNKIFNQYTNNDSIKKLLFENTNDGIKSFKISYKLLLIQMVKLSQLEWEKNEYCFEKMTAKRVRKKFKSLFEKIDQKNLLDIIFFLLRWQTLPGQLYRGTAINIDIKKLPPECDGIKREEILYPMLGVIAICDTFLKTKSSENEIKVRQILQNSTVNTSIGEFFDTVKYNYSLNLTKLSNSGKKLIKNFVKSKKIILSYVGANDVLKILKNSKIYLSKNEINHVIYYKQQRNYVLGNDLIERENINENDKNRDEKIYLLYHEPVDIIKKSFGYIYNNTIGKMNYTVKKKNELKKDPLKNLLEIFNKFEETKPLPLPLVKTITDSLSVYKELSNCKNKVFPARISIDDELIEEVWLPEIKKKESYESKHLSVIEQILGRLLNCIINNYGMARQFNKVDIDFSASVESSKNPEEHPWNKIMLSIKEDYGFKVFERYLKNTLTKRIEYTLNENRYIECVKKHERKLYEKYSYWKGKFEDIEWRITKGNNIILSLEIGGTGIDCQFYKLSLEPSELIMFEDGDKKIYLKNLFEKSFNIPTKAPSKYLNKDGKYRNIDAFAFYIYDVLSTQLEEDKKEFLTKLLCIGFCWPGPILQNRIAGTSSTLQKISGITGKVMNDTPQAIHQIDVVKAFKNRFSVETVNMVNDGDAELIGLVHNMDESLYNKKILILKGGTGLGGALLYKGKLFGLNELGKIIYDLNADNSDNEGKKSDEKWPKGDANKLFSQQLFKLAADEVGLNRDIITGHDIYYILDCLDNGIININKLKDKLELFGAIELTKHITTPYINFSDIVNSDGDIIAKTVSYDGSKYRVDDSSDFLKKETLRQMASDKNNSDADTKISDFTLIEMIKKMDDSGELPFDVFLILLGEQRVHNLCISQNSDYSTIKNLSRKFGQGAAELTALLYNIYHFDIVVMSGGVIKSINEDEFTNSYEETIKAYLKDRFFDQIINKKDKGQLNDELKTLKYDDTIKIQYVLEKSNNALIGCAIAGLDKFIQEQKLNELRELSKMISTSNNNIKVHEKVTFLTYNECKEFLKDNAKDMNIWIELEEENESITIEKL